MQYHFYFLVITTQCTVGKNPTLNVLRKFLCPLRFPTVLRLWTYIYLKRSEAQCLKITEKVSFNIASEASYIYILSGQKFIKKAKNGQFWRVFEKLKLAVKQCYQTGQF